MKRINLITIVSPKDERAETAERLLSDEIRKYKIPASIRMKSGISHLTETDGEWLIVICTENTPGDEDILKCISDFKERGLFDHILTLLVSGEPSESFPENLLHEKLSDGTVVEHEPLAADVRSSTIIGMRKLLKVEKLRIFAPIAGCAFDDLMNRKRRRKMRILLASACAALLGATIFLYFAIFRMRTVSAQNVLLNEQYELTENSFKATEQKRNEAEKDVTRFIATEALEVLETGDTETALLLCLERMGEYETEELWDAFNTALSAICKKGYVPVCKYDDYKGRMQEEENVSYEDAFPGDIYIDMPAFCDGYEEGSLIRLQKNSISGKGECGLYYGKLTIDGKDRYVLYAYFPGNPERGYFLRDSFGEYAYAFNTFFLKDDTVLLADDVDLRRFDLFYGDGGKEIPLFEDGNDNGWPGYKSSTSKRFTACDGADLLLFADGRKIYVFSQTPFRYLYCLDDDYIKNPKGSPPGFTVAMCDDGNVYMSFRSRYEFAVYDLLTGQFMNTVDTVGVTPGTHSAFSSDGYLLIATGSGCIIWDPESACAVDTVPYTGSYIDNCSWCGELSEDTGIRGSEAVYTGKIVYRKNSEEIPVPSDRGGQVELAKKLLGNRELTGRQKLLYHLE